MVLNINFVDFISNNLNNRRIDIINIGIMHCIHQYY